MFFIQFELLHEIFYRKIQVLNSQPLTDILTEVSGKRGQKQASSGKIRTPKKEERIWLDPAYLMGLIKKKILETLVEVAGVEPASRNLSHSASTCVVL